MGYSASTPVGPLGRGRIRRWAAQDSETGSPDDTTRLLLRSTPYYKYIEREWWWRLGADYAPLAANKQRSGQSKHDLLIETPCSATHPSPRRPIQPPVVEDKSLGASAARPLPLLPPLLQLSRYTSHTCFSLSLSYSRHQDLNRKTGKKRLEENALRRFSLFFPLFLRLLFPNKSQRILLVFLSCSVLRKVV